VKNLSARKADYSKFQELDVQIVGISADASFSQKAFADSLELPYPLLSDHPDFHVIQTYAGLRPYPPGSGRMVSERAFFLVDQQGIIQGKWSVGLGEVFPSEPILRRAQELTKQP
jgi:peroxiredoxin